MTVGEKVQKYRKTQGLSQEELAQKMLVSRQTISLWENDQTLPTVDNLIRLKEIFGVSVDQILCEDEEPEIQVAPLEQYTFSLTPEEAEIQRKKVTNRRLKKPRIYAAAVLLAFLLCLLSDEAQPAFMRGMFLAFFLINLISILRFKKQMKAAYGAAPELRYCYAVYQEYMEVTVLRGEVEQSMYRIEYDQLKNTVDCGGWIAFQNRNIWFPVPNGEISPESPLKEVLRNTAAKPEKDRWRAWSIVLFVLTLCSLHIALLAAVIVSGEPMMFVENIWTCFLILPIPAASVCYGFVLKKKGRKWKKNVIAGMIIAALLCVYGSFAFLFGDLYSDDPAYVARIEECTGVDIPEFYSITTQDYTTGTQSGFNGYMYYRSEIRFDRDAATTFEQQLGADDRWQRPIKSEMIGMLANIFLVEDDDYVLIYNVDLDTFNTLPAESGRYRMIGLSYDEEANKMIAMEYDLDFVK